MSVIRTWAGVDRAAAVTNWDNCFYAQNVSLYTDGELRRRPGTSYFASQGGNSVVSFSNTFNLPFVVYADGSGNVVSVSA